MIMFITALELEVRRRGLSAVRRGKASGSRPKLVEWLTSHFLLIALQANPIFTSLAVSYSVYEDWTQTGQEAIVNVRVTTVSCNAKMVLRSKHLNVVTYNCRCGKLFLSLR